MRRVLVTGGSGFVGRHLIDELLRNHVQIVATMRDRSQSSALPRSILQAKFDLTDAESFDPKALGGVDCIYHLAARVHVMRQSAADEERFNALNVRATEVLALAAAKAGVRRFVFLSSIKVNGERTVERPFRADDEPAPQDSYGVSKWRAEQALARISKATGLEVVIVRPPLVYGPKVGANFRRLLSLAYTGWPLPLAAIDNRRSLISVWNLVDCLWRASSDAQLSGRAWVVSDGEDVSTPRLVKLMASAMRRPVRLWRAPVPLLRAAGVVLNRTAEVGRLLDSLQVDISDTCTRMGWKPAVSVEEGIARTAAWYLEQRSAVR